MRRFVPGAVLLAWLVLALPSLASGQTAEARPGEPPIRRWLEVQTWTAFTRYRFIENSSGATTANQQQYKHTLRARFNIDAKRRYTINVGLFTGTNFTGTWDNTGLGTGVGQTEEFVKQLFAAAAPMNGLELQYGSIYINRGATTEITSYDDDGYIMGERVQVRRPKELYFDEISGTRGLIGPFASPAVADRWRGLHEANYGQVLVAKRFGTRILASADYTYHREPSGNDTLRTGVLLTLPRGLAIDGMRYEQYYRFSGPTGGGFALMAERQIGRLLHLQAGYVTIDERYVGFATDHSGWNADRIQRGRRLAVYGAIPIWRELSAAPFYTHAFPSPYPVALKDRFDLVVQYDLVARLRRAGML